MPTGEQERGRPATEPGVPDATGVHDAPDAAEALPASDDPILQAAANWQREGWEAGPHLLAALSIMAADQAIRAARASVVEPYGLTPSRHDALAELFFAPEGQEPMGVLSRRLTVHPTSVTSTVDALVDRGLAERAPHPDDGRARLARITDRGRTAIVDTCRHMAEIRCGLSALTNHEALLLFELLRKVRTSTTPTVVAPTTPTTSNDVHRDGQRP